MEYAVVVWREPLSDGAIGYAAVCPAISHAHGMGDTEAETLADVADTMAFFLEEMPEKVKVGQATADKIAELQGELSADGINYWMRLVAPAPGLVTAEGA